jgi:hypothetical protein
MGRERANKEESERRRENGAGAGAIIFYAKHEKNKSNEASSAMQ